MTFCDIVAIHNGFDLFANYRFAHIKQSHSFCLASARALKFMLATLDSLKPKDPVPVDSSHCRTAGILVNELDRPQKQFMNCSAESPPTESPTQNPSDVPTQQRRQYI